MTSPQLYALFPGCARDALEFYAGVFGGAVELHTFGDFGRGDGPAEAIAHGVLSGPVELYGSDAGEGQSAVQMAGMMLGLLGTADPAQLHAWFDRLADGGRVIDPLAPKPWGASDGQVIDRFGLHWLVGYEPATADG